MQAKDPVVDRVEVVEHRREASQKGKMQEDDADTLEPRQPIPNFPRTRATDALLPGSSRESNSRTYDWTVGTHLSYRS